MAKKIKFPLKLKDDFPVRALEELKEHFDLDKIVAYFLDGKLLTWLKDRYYDVEVDAIRNLQKDDPELQQKLAQIFGIEHFDSYINIDEVEEHNRRLGILRQFTSDPAVLEQVASVAFNQEDLGDLIDDGVQKIFLCNNSFIIPLSIENKTYIGIGKSTAVIRSNEKIDFDSRNISFQDISFDFDYQKLINSSSLPENFYQLGLEAENKGDYTSAIDFYLKALENKNLDNDWSAKAMYNLSILYFNGKGVSQNYEEGRKWLERAAVCGYDNAQYLMGKYVTFGEFGYSKDLRQGEELMNQAANNGKIDAMLFLGKNYIHGGAYSGRYGYGYGDKSGKWYFRAANAGNVEAMYKLALGYPYETFDVSSYTGNIIPGSRRIVISPYGNSKESLNWLIKVYDEKCKDKPFIYWDESSVKEFKKALNRIYNWSIDGEHEKKNPKLLDSIKQKFPWFYPGIK